MVLQLSLEMDGIITYINTCYPNVSKVESCNHVSLTSSLVCEQHVEMNTQQDTIVKNCNSSDVNQQGNSGLTMLL